MRCPTCGITDPRQVCVGCTERHDLIPLNRLATDQKTVAERRWKAPLMAPKPQLPADHGLFSDEASQLDLVEMFMDPTND